MFELKGVSEEGEGSKTPVRGTQGTKNANSARDRKAYTPEQLLKLWALRIQGGSLKDPTKPANGGDADPVDDEGVIVGYVQTTDGFHEAERVLRWFYVYGKDLSKFDPREPGESLDYALGRLRWSRWLGVPLRELGPSIEKQFRHKLLIKCRDNPLFPVTVYEEIVIPQKK